LKITFEANLSVGKKKKFLGVLLAALVLLSASSIYLLNENLKLSSNLQTLRADYTKLNATYNILQQNYSNLTESRGQLFDRLNKTVTLERKYWEVSARNVTLRPKDTMTITIYIDNAAGYLGIDGIDRMELTWVGIYSPSLTAGQMRTATVDQYIGPNENTERWIGERAIAYGSYQDMIKIRHPISPNETILRESVTSVTFFFENYNYLGYMRPGTSITIKLFYDGPVSLTIQEVEFYLVGFITVKLGQAEDFKSTWIGTNVEIKIRHYGEML
jgi:hypothetical protein